jgi:hypothetical protein
LTNNGWDSKKVVIAQELLMTLQILLGRKIGSMTMYAVTKRRLLDAKKPSKRILFK